MNQPVLPNPDVYLNHLPPAFAADFEATRCMTIVIMGATLLDILVYIPDDLRIISQSRFDAPIICFILSRLIAAVYILGYSIRMTTPLSDFRSPIYASAAICVFMYGCATYLFLRRVHAVYADNRWVRWVFSVLWFINAGSDLVIPLGVIPGYIPGTHYYAVATERPVVTLSLIASVIFDTSVFLAISYKIATTHSDVYNEPWVSWRTLVSGRALPRLSRAILKGGQQYYLITVTVNILAVFLLFLPSVHPIVKDTVVIPIIPLTASMASRVFRNLKLFALNGGDSTNFSYAIPLSEVA